MMMSRAAFGLWGSYFSSMLCIFESVIYVRFFLLTPAVKARLTASQFGMQAYFGGQAVVVILNSLSYDFMTMKNTLPER